MNQHTWRSLLLAAYCAQEVREELSEARDLEELLGGLVDEGARAWPQLELAPEQLLQAIANLLHAGNPTDACKRLEAVNAPDLHLATATLAGVPQAAELFCREMEPAIQASLHKLGASLSDVDEIRQRVFHLVLVGDRPQLATYLGRGSLRSWVVTIAVRTYRRTAGSAARHGAAPGDLSGLADTADGAELAYLKETYRDQLRQALSVAARTLDERQRSILRHQHLGRLSIDALAELYEVHRATAARWAAAARQKLFDATRKELAVTVGVQLHDTDSIIRLVRSELDISIRLLLADKSDAS